MAVEEVVSAQGGRVGSVGVGGRAQQAAGVEAGEARLRRLPLKDEREGQRRRILISEGPPCAWRLHPGPCTQCAQLHTHSCMALGRSPDPGAFILLSVKMGILEPASWGVVRIR